MLYRFLPFLLAHSIRFLFQCPISKTGNLFSPLTETNQASEGAMQNAAKVSKSLHISCCLMDSLW
jgi:hypothetical protein